MVPSCAMSSICVPPLAHINRRHFDNAPGTLLLAHPYNYIVILIHVNTAGELVLESHKTFSSLKVNLHAIGYQNSSFAE